MSSQVAVIDEHVERISKSVLDAAFCVHSELGPGLLESVYEVCLEKELRNRRLDFARQRTLVVSYRGELLDASLRLDFVVADCVIVELKAVESLLSIHKAQLLTYLKLSGVRLGFLINFNSIHLRDGIKRVVL